MEQSTNERKIHGYLGFAARSRNLITGYNTCMSAIERGKIKLLIIAEEVGDATEKKLKDKCEYRGIPCFVYGSAETLSHITGKRDKGLFGITDQGLAESIQRELENTQKKEGSDIDESI